MFRTLMIVGAIAGVAHAASASAAELTVKMRNQGAEGPMVFEPSSAKLKPGASMGAVAMQQPQPARAVAEQDKVFTQNAEAKRPLAQIGAACHRLPITAHEFAHGRTGADMGERGVAIGCTPGVVAGVGEATQGWRNGLIHGLLPRGRIDAPSVPVLCLTGQPV